jgi:hypothetical protein
LHDGKVARRYDGFIIVKYISDGHINNIPAVALLDDSCRVRSSKGVLVARGAILAKQVCVAKKSNYLVAWRVL